MKKITGVDLSVFASRLWAIYAPYKQRIWLTIAWVLFMQAVDILPPYMMKFTIDFLNDCLIHEKAHNVERFFCLIAAMLASSVAINKLQIKRRQYARDILIDTENDLPPKLLDRLLGLSSAYHQASEPVAIIERGVNKTVDVANVISGQAVAVAIQAILTAAILWHIYAPTLLIVVPIMGLFALQTRKLKQDTKSDRLDRHARIPIADRLLGEAVRNALTVRIFNTQKREVKRLAEKRGEIRTLNRQEFLPNDAADFRRGNLLALGKYAVFGLCAWAVLHHQITLGSLVFIFDRASVLLGSCSPIGAMVDQLVEAVEPIMRMTDIFHEPQTAADPAQPIMLSGESDISVEFVDVKFSYRPQGASASQAHRQALDGISLAIPRGKKIGIFGPSGAGKTTLAELILRLKTPDSGSVRIHGADVRLLSATDISRRATMVTQYVQLFYGSVANNIRYGRPDATMEEVERAAALANAHEFIVGMPRGYDTIIGGSEQPQVSGGERQRIGIARGILMNPEILVMDEATSNIDGVSQASINESLQRLRECGTTIIVIAHRLSTIRDADRIVGMENGKIVEQGAHEELIALNGIYARMIAKR